jgi:hypothetical protein
MDAELDAFFERFIAAYNARDEEAFARCFNLPVTAFGPPPDERLGYVDLPVLSTEEDLHALLPPPGDYSIVDSVSALAELAPFIAEGAPPEVRPGVVATISRRDFSGRAHQRLQVLYVLSRQDGRIGIKLPVQLALHEPVR